MKICGTVLRPVISIMLRALGSILVDADLLNVLHPLFLSDCLTRTQ